MSASLNDVVNRGDYVSQVAIFREDLRQSLRTLDCADYWRTAAYATAETGLEHDAAVMARLHADGWNRYGWPEAAGGLGGNEIHRAVLYEELANAMLPIPAQAWTLEVMGPAILKFAPHLAREYLPRCLDGSEWWGQGFSEPESGSDLASLQTRATDDGSGWFIVNGQKIWTSHGGTAKRLCVLVRTGSPESRHRGLTMMLIDTDAPGVTVHPIALASGRRELAEVFFDDVRVPPERLVGEIGAGWAVTMFLMQYERGMYGYAALNNMLMELGRLREYMVTRGAGSAQRERFARVYVEVIAAQARAATTVRKLAAGESVDSESSIDKLLCSEAERAVYDLILDLTRDHMMVGTGSGPDELDTARAKWWYSRAATVMGGTAGVQRGIIADHILGLPKESRAS
ncbi:acyl-CoA dehydrogenase [Mycobacterium sp. E342]|uniref:acyl-CoA dehydrogenase family protein n=1 Tax=Mycobacterium sp. E342 TaxID=1834147 RepID=UPI0007FE67D7|nr:acyl-CoA dehydrogenase family protein [Mycobacterium sp. E342]OBH32157.1 acyl-CoA dehydrogenase [Mycobacterium sp. E342]